MTFSDSLTSATKSKSPICVGLDPNLAKLPEGIEKTPAGVLEFCKGIVDVTHDLCACYKPQIAYYEVMGWEGIKVFWEVCEYIKSKDSLVIADAKRNDIGSTCDAYAEAYLYEGSSVDALTVTPYLGSDGIRPFMERCAENDKGIFILVKTSNPSSGELQDLPSGDACIHEHVAEMVSNLGQGIAGEESQLSSIGAVVGATYPEEMKYLRSLMPQQIFLVPGYGAQGGGAEDVKDSFLPNGTGAVINAARSIIFASSDSDWKEAARSAAETMKEDIANVIGS